MLEKNLDILKPLITSGAHWGGIHAVYNLYNATRLIELTKFARSRNLTIHWQSLYQPECLDPARLGKEIAELATTEIENLLALDICLLDERQFFQTVLTGLSGTDDLRRDFRQHITEIEQKYHTDQQSQFAALWPEIYNLI